MKNNKFSFEAEYFVFARKSRAVIMFLLLCVVCVANFFLAGVFWQLATLTGPLLSVAILCFMDYFVFAGFNSRKSQGMNLLKSSPRGRALVESALKQDIVNKSVYTLAGSLFALFSVLKFNESIDKPFVIAYAAGGFSTCLILLRLVLLLNRAKGLTMQVHIFICYLCYSVGNCILLPMIFLSETGSLLIMIIYAVVAETGSILTGRWLIISCMKVYDSSFHDAEIEKNQEVSQ